ncbi:hypothetical protein BVRB_025400, partial [Beta vulgaris subsp. vulgaris]
MSRLISFLGAVICLLLVSLPQRGFAGEDVPVLAALSVSPASEGEIIELKLKLTVKGAWHVYGKSPGSGGEQPMQFKLTLPEGVEAVGDWVWPANPHLLTAGEHVFTHKLKRAELKGKATIDLTVMYQACDPQMCLPPDMLLLEVEVTPASRADVDLKALENELLPEVKDNARVAYDALSYPEQLRYLDQHWRNIFDRCEAFVNKYPEDLRARNVLRLCLTQYPPFFHEQKSPFSPEL